MSKRTPTKHRTAAAPTLLDTLKEVWDQAQDVCEMDADTARATLLEIQQIAGAALIRVRSCDCGWHDGDDTGHEADCASL